ncbi:MAG TPA: DUF4867 family protein [Clostridiaceae bacterium]|nr:DUF4867 family protein [Clostridiaceae bacterium]
MFEEFTDNGNDASSLQGFLMEPGDAIELYPLTLHFCPCQVQTNGFGCIVILPEGTNLPLERPSGDRKLFRKNKWLVSHSDNKPVIGS